MSKPTLIKIEEIIISSTNPTPNPIELSINYINPKHIVNITEYTNERGIYWRIQTISGFIDTITDIRRVLRIVSVD